MPKVRFEKYIKRAVNTKLGLGYFGSIIYVSQHAFLFYRYTECL